MKGKIVSELEELGISAEEVFADETFKEAVKIVIQEAVSQGHISEDKLKEIGINLDKDLDNIKHMNNEDLLKLLENFRDSIESKENKSELVDEDRDGDKNNKKDTVITIGAVAASAANMGSKTVKAVKKNSSNDSIRVVHTKEQLKKAKDDNINKIIVKGDLADKIKKTKPLFNLSKVAIGIIIAAIGTSAVTGGVSLFAAKPVALAVGAKTGAAISIEAIIIASSIGLSLLYAVHKDCNVKISTDIKDSTNEIILECNN